MASFCVLVFFILLEPFLPLPSELSSSRSVVERLNFLERNVATDSHFKMIVNYQKKVYSTLSENETINCHRSPTCNYSAHVMRKQSFGIIGVCTKFN